MLPQAIFSLGIFHVHMYGVMIAVGILFCFGVLYFYGKKTGVEMKLLDFIFYTAIAAIALGFGCAALCQALFNYISNPEAGFNINSGITFLGGFIGGALVFLGTYFILRKKLKINLLDALPFIPCMITVAHAFGRIGCLFAGCCYGKVFTECVTKVENVPWQYFEFKVINTDTGKFLFYRYALPTQLYEAIFLFILFGVLTMLFFKKKGKYNLPIYFIAYGVFRFCNEFLRDDDRGEFLGTLSPSQTLSICLIVIGIAAIFLLKYLYSNRKPKITEVSQNEHQD